jgi:hypothetical protein
MIVIDCLFVQKVDHRLLVLKVDLGSDHLSDDSSGKGGGGAVSDSHPEILTGRQR